MWKMLTCANQSDTCAKNPSVTAPANPQCQAAFLLFHVTTTGAVYVENCWFWVADHELDRRDFNQINLYNGRGVLINSQDAVWLWGTASEHNVLYNYQISNAKNVYMALIQTETPYYQSNPDATTPFTSNPAFKDPVFNGGAKNNKAWGVRVLDSQDVFIYGAGLYSFFENYDQTCVPLNNCQGKLDLSFRTIWVLTFRRQYGRYSELFWCPSFRSFYQGCRESSHSGRCQRCSRPGQSQQLLCCDRSLRGPGYITTHQVQELRGGG